MEGTFWCLNKLLHAFSSDIETFALTVSIVQEHCQYGMRKLMKFFNRSSCQPVFQEYIHKCSRISKVNDTDMFFDQI